MLEFFLRQREKVYKTTGVNPFLSQGVAFMVF